MEPQGTENLDVPTESNDTDLLATIGRLTNHGSLKCPKCEYVAGRKDTLKRHIDSQHSEIPAMRRTSTRRQSEASTTARRAIRGSATAAGATPRGSEIWRYFSRVDARTAKCSMCEFVDVHADSTCGLPTTHLWRHLKSGHSEVFKQTKFFQARKPTLLAKTEIFQTRNPKRNVFKRCQKPNASSGVEDDAPTSSKRRLLEGNRLPPSAAAGVDFIQQAEAATTRAAHLEQELENVRASEKSKKAEALKLFEIMKAQFEQNEAALRQQLREKNDEIELLRSGAAPPVSANAEEGRYEQEAQAANARAAQSEQELNEFKEAQKTKDADTLQILEVLKAVHTQKEAHLLQQLLAVVNENNRLRSTAPLLDNGVLADAASAKCAQLEHELERLKAEHAGAIAAERRRQRALQEQHAKKEADLREHLQTAAFKVLTLSDELEHLKNRDGDDQPDRLPSRGQQSGTASELQNEIAALSEQVNACKAEKARLEGALEHLRNSLRLADEQRKSSESNGEALLKELEELKNQLRSSEERWNAKTNEVEQLKEQLSELKEENDRIRTWPE